MYLRSLYLRNFRLYEEAFFEFDREINRICGLNGIGKTTLLEAVYLLISGRSFRGASSSELIRFGEERSQVQAVFVKHGVEQVIKAVFDSREKKFYYNQNSIPSSTSLFGLLRGVVMQPDDAALIKGPPALRRQYLDMQIAQSDPLYVHHLTRYHRAMRQRNCLLKAKTKGGYESWEEEMSTSAVYICSRRHATVGRLKDICRACYHQLANDPLFLTIDYKSFIPPEKLEEAKVRYLEILNKNRRREMELGITLNGPHKDDLLFYLGDKEARHYASEGQARLAACVLKLAEWELLSCNSEEKPLMLMDDVGISLDEKRKRSLLNYSTALGQVMLAATEPHEMEGRLITLPISFCQRV